MKYVMVIDQKRCTGCHTCVIACKTENDMPSNVNMNIVLTEGSNVVDLPYATKPMGDMCTMDDFKRAAGTVRVDYLTRSCQHCEEAPCVSVCPSNATVKREDGIVSMNPAKCIGCNLCMDACPYGYGTMRVLIQNPVSMPDFRLGDQDAQKTINNTVKKCTFCAHRVDRGEEPFCVKVCPARARHFGDIEDTGSDVYRLLQTRESHTIADVQGVTGTTPSVYFLKHIINN